MESRYYDIDAAQTGTCEWLSQHKMYREWVERNRGLLWIKGKPGSGKSTLLRHALDDAKKKRNVKENLLILSFFFHGRGTELQRTPEGFYRSLLHQLSKTPDAVSDVVSTFQEKCETFGEVGKAWQWHPKQLRELFESSIREALKLRPICLFVDALDECGEKDATMLAQRFKDLLDSLRSTAYNSFHICFTCRPYPIVALDSEFEICVEEGNGTDISNFVGHQLSELEPTILPRILNLITERANGVFLWASLIVKEIVSLNLKTTKSEEMEDAILQVPQELDDLYRKLIEEMGSDSVLLIQCICVAMRPLSIADWRWAMAMKTDYPYSSLQQCQYSPDYKPDDKSIKKEIQTLSHGLIEVTSNKTIQFIHQTVKDFFVENGLWLLKPLGSVPVGISESDFAVGMAHYELSKICVRFLKMVPNTGIFFNSAGRTYDLSLSRYAKIEWVQHVQQSEQRGILQDAVLQDNLLDCFPWLMETVPSPLMRAHCTLFYHSLQYSYQMSYLSHVASRFGLTGLLQAMLRRSKSVIDEKDERGRTPLLFAAERGHEATARLLLGYGADMEANDENGQTPLFFAAEIGHEGVVRLLLKHGAACGNIKDCQGKTPLFIAAARWDANPAVIQLLLEHGAACDINVKDHQGMTPLSIAAYKGDKRTLQLLRKYRDGRNA
ncbi:ankyrin repeat protein [Metarhizium robertsii]|uniref:Ankyrin repeat protein n=2 Tax=Metarhizium robertsii TaxID=568076 RepID=E9F7Q7_METRA|nr:Ankyrin repeat protein [Metarhizium robertsii ARSEF 23]EFY96195.1 Ankyrin repeat protein [Metarhizium robertsii ARSEF 23]EXU98451.1 ankyrin repeat protein [Metarhizium robertsii]